MNDDLHFVTQPLWKEGAQRPVNQAGNQRLAFGRPSFAAEKSSWNPARGIAFLNVIDCQRKEILTWPRAFGADPGASASVSSTSTSAAPPAWRAISPVSRRTG